MTPHPKEVQKARSFLYAKHPSGLGINPTHFAAAAKEQNTSFPQLMHFISLYYSRGQNQSLFRQQELSDIAQSGGSQ